MFSHKNKQKKIHAKYFRFFCFVTTENDDLLKRLGQKAGFFFFLKKVGNIFVEEKGQKQTKRTCQEDDLS